MAKLVSFFLNSIFRVHCYFILVFLGKVSSRNLTLRKISCENLTISRFWRRRHDITVCIGLVAQFNTEDSLFQRVSSSPSNIKSP